MKSSVKNDTYRWKDAEVCIRCDLIYPSPEGSGLSFCVCSKCIKELKRLMKHYDEHGLYAVKG